MRFSWWQRSSCWWRQSACAEVERPWLWNFCKDTRECRWGVYRISENCSEIENGGQQGRCSTEFLEPLLCVVLMRISLRGIMCLYFHDISLGFRVSAAEFLFEIDSKWLRVYFQINHFAFFHDLLFLNNINAKVNTNATPMEPRNNNNRM